MTEPTIIQYHVLDVNADAHISHLENLVTLSGILGDQLLFSLAHTPYTKPAKHAHNRMVDQFLKNDPKPDWLWIWADDMIVMPSSYKLLDYLDKADILVPSVPIWLGNHEMPVLTAVFKEPNAGPYVFRFTTFPVTLEPHEVDAAGTGGILVNRRVFEDPRMKLHDAADEDDVDVYFDDVVTPSGKRVFGHDLDFTWRAKQLGYKILFVPEAECDHVKTLGLNQVRAYAILMAEMLRRRLEAVDGIEAIKLQILGKLARDGYFGSDAEILDWLQVYFGVKLGSELPESPDGTWPDAAAEAISAARKRYCQDLSASVAVEPT